VKEYPDQFWEDGSHGHALRLLKDAALPSGLVLDLGCAAGPLADPVAALGYDYVGLDIDPQAIADLSARGFEAHELDLGGHADELLDTLRTVLNGRVPVAVLALDVLEHLVEPTRLLQAVAGLAAGQDQLQLVVSIPNVTHLDVAIKLLLGRWDLTKIGLLDDTHVRFFNNRLVTTTLARGGWVETAADDVVSEISDQLFPADSPALRPGTPLRELLRRVRTTAEGHGDTYQFVRRYRHDPDAAAQLVPPDDAAQPGSDDAFLTVVVRSADAATGLLGDLTRQGADDVELLLCHDPNEDAVAVPPELEARTRRLAVTRKADWRNGAIAQARGRYLVFLDSRTRLSPHYLQTIRGAVVDAPGRVVQVAAVSASTSATSGVEDVDSMVGRLESVAQDPLDLVSTAPFGAICLDTYAVPRQACDTNGLRFEDSAGESAAAVFVFGAVEQCGIVRSAEQVTILHPAQYQGLAVHLAVLQKQLSQRPLVVPEGAGSQLLVLRESAGVIPERDALARELAATRDHVETLNAYVRQQDAELVHLRQIVARRLRSRVGRKVRAVQRRIGRGRGSSH
jgi:SAM-dependent methyltransferase